MATKIFHAYGTKVAVKSLLEKGIPLKKILPPDLPPGWLDDPLAVITPEQQMRITERALDLSGDPAFAFHTTHQMWQLVDMGLLGYAIMSAGTLLEAMKIAVSFWDLTGSPARVTVEENSGAIVLRLAPLFPMRDPRLWRFVVEGNMGACYSAAKTLINKDLELERLDFSFPKPPHSDLYRRYFKCPLRFEQDEDMAVVPLSYLNNLTVSGNPLLAELCRNKCREMLERLPMHDEFVRAVRQGIMQNPAGAPLLSEIAKGLNVSPRGLQRRLRRNNTSFNQLHQEIRSELAKEYLTTTSLTIDQISDLIGFAETAAFRKSFRKWTGLTPTRFRKNNS